MRITAAAASALLIFEFTLAAATMMPVLQIAVDRFSALTRTTPSPAVIFLIGLLDLIGVIGVIIGFWRPLPAVAAGLFFAALAGTILFRQITHGDRGTDLLPYTLFASAGIILVITRLTTRHP